MSEVIADIISIVINIIFLVGWIVLDADVPPLIDTLIMLGIVISILLFVVCLVFDIIANSGNRNG